MKKEESLKTNMAKRFITMLMSVCILLGSIAGYADVVLAAEYDSDETVIETKNLNKSGRAIFNGKVIEGSALPDLHEGIIRLLDDETEVVASLMYGNDKYVNGQSIFSDSYIQINVGEAQLSNIIVAEEDIIINASTMCSDEYTIIYSKSGNIRFNIGEMDFNGIIYAPHGEVTFSASQVHMGGRIIADEVNIYAGVFEIDGLEEYRNIVDRLGFLTSDTILNISRAYDEENGTYSIDIASENEATFDRLEVYARYDKENEFSYLCELAAFEELGLADTYDTVDLVVKGTTKYNEIIYSNVRSFHMDEEEVLYAHLDTDEDGIADGEEILYTKTNPYKADSDEDEISDYVECFYLLTDPNTKTSDGDYDNDGLSNFEELKQGTNPFLADCDLDGLLDGEDKEPLVYHKTGIEADYTSACVVVGKYDKVMNDIGEAGEIYQYIYNYLTEQIKAICYNDREVMYFYDANSNMIADIRKYKNEYRANSSKYDVNGNVIAYSNNGNIYEYTYDELGNVLSASVNGEPVVVTSDDKVIYGNGDIILTDEIDGGYVYSLNGEETQLITSDSNLGIEKCLYKKTGIYYEYKYTEEALSYIVTNTGYKVEYSGDEEEYKVNYTYGDEKKEQTIYLNSETGKTLLISGDLYENTTADDSALASITDGASTVFETEYALEAGKIVKVYYNDSERLSYTYNENGQIISISEGNEKIWGYEYNLVGQLIAVYNYVDKTVERYSYDMYNNIKRAELYVHDGGLGDLISCDVYEYNSEINTDRVTCFNGAEISYDEIGNPLTYYDGKELAWSGRNLDSIVTADSCAEYEYDVNGLRVQKNVDGKVTDFYYEGEDIIVEASDEHVIWYIYDNATNMLGFSYNGNDYYYVKNASNDVVAIVDSEGNYVCSYEYDPWGRLLSIEGDEELARLNPIRYRGYYYDEESGFYYLKTRYYDPEIRRFISMDDVCDVAYEMVDPNLYAYCCNDPVNLYDPEGRAYLDIGMFSIGEFNKECCEYLEDDIRDVWSCVIYIDYKCSDKSEVFINWWNGLDDKDIVIINTHGAPDRLLGKNTVCTSINARYDLEKKDIKLLILLGCNCGHWDYRTKNIAWYFSKKITGGVLASDGTVYINKKETWYGEKSISYTSEGDGKFKELFLTATQRDNKGWLLYIGKSEKVNDLDLYYIDAYKIYSLYNRKVWVLYK